MIQETSLREAENLIKSLKVVILDFYAEWCIPCKAVEEILEQVLRVFRSRSDIAFLRIDVEKEKDALGRFEVYGLPTVIVFQNGVEVRRFSGVPRNFGVELTRLIKSLSS
ncbi:thioredoxin family protein [Infirmifilum lucidum]|uniref:Thioredoxin family protein n=1 Tax=Infirmifilum lucidum TaxID=2776706 RepID=A0A7L9FEJ8_9CREN|nr:thioredoxin family protein [Infirmifilum lucidum]QOJ78220.1 thioredoxin family protein [Infirmifilum lucidum]